MAQVSPTIVTYSEKTSQVDMSFKDLSYIVKLKNGSEKKVLNNISGVMKSGEVTAILGPSGGGKTSLLNILAGKIVNSSNIKLFGSIMANGKTFSNDDFTKFSGYVMQSDILLDFLTVREAIQFSANLKVQGSDEYKLERVNEIIKGLKLERCQNTLIGGERVKGISGGERKRVNIACELINDPQVLFLDEPTSGLDSFTAYIVIKILKDYAVSKGKNVIMSIHSPNKDVWDLFDNVIFMSQGRFVYQGKQKEVKTFFDSLGLYCPLNICQADYYMEQISARSIEKNPQMIQTIFHEFDNKIEPQVQASIQSNIKQNEGIINTYEFYQSSFAYQVKQIAKRNLIKIRRDPFVFKSEVMQMIFLSVFFGLIFLRMPAANDETPQRDINDRNGIIFLSIVTCFKSGMLSVVLSFPLERGVFMREENSKYYTPMAYAVGKFISDVFFKCLLPVIYGTIIYFMAGLTIDHAQQYFIFILVLILLILIGNAIGNMVGIIFDNVRTSIAITPLILLPLMLFSGLFKRRADLAAWIGWLQYLSPLTYGLESLIRNDYRDLSDDAHNPINVFEFNIGMQECIWVLIGMFGAFQILSVVFLYIKRGSIQ